jgi:hypothetical protein
MTSGLNVNGLAKQTRTIGVVIERRTIYNINEAMLNQSTLHSKECLGLFSIAESKKCRE